MRMRFLLVPALLLSAAVAFADDAPAKEQSAAAQTAVFTVPDVDDETVVKNLTMALAKEEGLISAKANAEAGTFLVTFDSEKTDIEALVAVFAEVAPEAKLESVRPAEAKAAAHDCGKCPSKSTCGSAKKDHAEKSAS